MLRHLFAAGLRCVAAFGGLSKFEQFKELKSGERFMRVQLVHANKGAHAASAARHWPGHVKP
jgi:hypothetical protein